MINMFEIIAISSAVAIGALTLIFSIKTYYSNTYTSIDENWEDCNHNHPHSHEHRVTRGVEVSFRRNN